LSVAVAAPMVRAPIPEVPMRLFLALSLVVVAAACDSKPDFPLYSGDCAVLDAKLKSLPEVNPDTAETARKMCSEHTLRDTAAQDFLAAKNAQDFEWAVKEELKWMEFHAKRK
jgi:hypothetical protein